MRVDKYLWSVRVFKTRSMASQHCREGKVFVDGQAVKPSRELKEGQVVEVRKGAIRFRHEVISFPKSRVGAALVAQHMKDVTLAEELEKLDMIRLSQQDRPKGVGRPTKRDRRDWEKTFKP
ncbi:MAG: S4 domain-containing protein [Bacteroidetes bacterium]|jgi:ribosome-associated heat shock protein Hsp15|nr:S4 domain-containing protein [Bacteroidota bacterium]